VGIGLALRERGHRVRVVANPYFRSLIEREGLGFIPVGTEADYRRMATNPAFWRRLQGTREVLPWVASAVRPVYEIVTQNHVPGETVVVASSLGLGARVAQDRLGIPTASVHLQPSIFLSAIDPPRLGGIVTPRWMPMWIKRRQVATVDRVCDPLVGPELNALRREVGLPPVTRVMTEYLHSPQRVIGVFPAWFGLPAADWPRQARLTQFPLYDERGVSPMSDDLRRFLDEGDPPIAFTPGSAMWSGHQFFAESARACELLGRRGLLLSRHPDHLPRRLPPGVRQVPYAPFSELLPRCAAIVHHAGIGTSAQALRAGIPQLATPFAHDQHDNAARMMRLGVAAKVEPRAYRAGGVAARLRAMLECEEVKSHCRAIARWFDGIDSMEETCELIEELVVSDFDLSRDESHIRLMLP
jgi:UDP:flavonoid glycosyltransferase YjiC (YdhE family)